MAAAAAHWRAARRLARAGALAAAAAPASYTAARKDELYRFRLVQSAEAALVHSIGSIVVVGGGAG